MTQKMNKRIVIVGAGVAGINAATKLVDNGYPGELITIIDKGKDPNNRLPEEVMEGMLGAGGWSDGKLTYHTAIGGQLSKYCGDDKAMDLMDQVISNFRRFHPKPEEIFCSDPVEEPEFIKPAFGLRLFPVWHIGSNYLHEIAKTWYQYLLSKGVKFKWECEVTHITPKEKLNHSDVHGIIYREVNGSRHSRNETCHTLIFAVGKSGIDFGKQLAEEWKLETEPKSVQIGVRFEAPQKYFQKLIDVSYDFKLYQKPNEQVSLRSFCTNNNAAYVAVEETYGDISYNGHAKKGEEFRNNMTNFGILMEIKGIENPFEWCRDAVKICQIRTIDDVDIKGVSYNQDGRLELDGNVKVQKIEGMFYSPKNTRKPSTTSEGEIVKSYPIDNLGLFKKSLGEYADYIINFIDDMNKVFKFGDDWGMYIPEVKYLSPEPLVDYTNLSLPNYNNIHFVGDALSARGITVAGSHGIYVAEDILRDN